MVDQRFHELYLSHKEWEREEAAQIQAWKLAGWGSRGTCTEEGRARLSGTRCTVKGSSGRVSG